LVLKNMAVPALAEMLHGPAEVVNPEGQLITGVPVVSDCVSEPAPLAGLEAGADSTEAIVDAAVSAAVKSSSETAVKSNAVTEYGGRVIELGLDRVEVSIPPADCRL
jgi:hypothetical protein